MENTKEAFFNKFLPQAAFLTSNIIFI